MNCIDWTKVLIFITDSNNAMALLTFAMVVLTSIIVIISFCTYKKNNSYQKKQLFENTFFNMMKQLEDIVSKLIIEDSKSAIKNFSTVTGREVFRFMFTEYTVFIFDEEIIDKVDRDYFFIYPHIDYKKGLNDENDTITDYIKAEGIFIILSTLGIKGYESCLQINLLDHYFRYLYRIMRFVDEADFLESNTSVITERYKYMGILRATLSPYELVFLFYNNLSKYGNEKVKPLIEKYSFFKSLRKELLANTRLDYEFNIIEDEFDNDYNRYIKTKSPEKEFKHSLKYKASAVSKADNKFLKTN